MLAWAANLKPHKDSFALLAIELKLTTVKVLPSLLRQFCNKYVSLELQKGMWEFFLLSATKTLVRLLRLLVVEIVSLALTLEASLRFKHIERAKSTRLRVLFNDCVCMLCFAARWRVNTEWDLLDTSFILVLATERCFAARSMMSLIAFTLSRFKDWTVRPDTKRLPFGRTLILCFLCTLSVVQNRSHMISL